jgi:hypothetical protein
VSNLWRLSGGKSKGKGRKRVTLKRCLLVIILFLLSLSAVTFIVRPKILKDIEHYTIGLQCQRELDRLGWPKSLPDEPTGTKPNAGDREDESWSRLMSASELIHRASHSQDSQTSPNSPNSQDKHGPPRILHQSWKTHHLPENFEKWSKSWRRMHGSNWT